MSTFSMLTFSVCYLRGYYSGSEQAEVRLPGFKA